MEEIVKKAQTGDKEALNKGGNYMKKKLLIIIPIVVVIIVLVALVTLHVSSINKANPEEILKQYFSYIEQGKYEELYNMVKISGDYSKEDFIARNENIYQGIAANEIEFVEEEKEKVTITYLNKMNTRCGNVEFKNTATLSKDEDKQYKINWSSNLIFPELNNDYKVRVNTIEAERGELLDKNGNLIATQGKISSIGIVPGK